MPRTKCWTRCEPDVPPDQLQNHFPVSTHFATQAGSARPQYEQAQGGAGSGSSNCKFSRSSSICGSALPGAMSSKARAAMVSLCAAASVPRRVYSRASLGAPAVGVGASGGRKATCGAEMWHEGYPPCSLQLCTLHTDTRQPPAMPSASQARARITLAPLWLRALCNSNQRITGFSYPRDGALVPRSTPVDALPF